MKMLIIALALGSCLIGPIKLASADDLQLLSACKLIDVSVSYLDTNEVIPGIFCKSPENPLHNSPLPIC